MIFAIVSLYFRVEICLNFVWSGGILLAFLWFSFVWFIGLTSQTLFILGAFTGLIFSPLFPLSFGLINQRLTVIPLLLSLLLSGSALGSIVFQKLAGRSFDELFFDNFRFFFHRLGFVMDLNPNHFPTILILCLILSISFYVLSTIVFYIDKNQREKSSTKSKIVVKVTDPTNPTEEEEMIKYLSHQEEEEEEQQRSDRQI